MRVLVTGANGFVGSHLARMLVYRGHEVIRTDISFALAAHSPAANLAFPGVTRALIERERPDYVAHLAARYGRLLCRDAPHAAVSDNAAATTELAAVCAERDIPVLYTSSSEVYGDHGEDTISETSELRTPTTIYGLSKLWGEQALELYLPPEQRCIVRMNMLYGPGQQAGYGRCALATFIANALDGSPLTVHRGTTRSWLYIADAIRALCLLIEGGHTGVFNLGNGEELHAMSDLAALVCAIANSHSRIEMVDVPAGQIAHKHYDSRKIRAALDWEPLMPLSKGIERTIEWQAETGDATHGIAQVA